MGIVVFAVSQAFFSDTETSAGNALVAGALDLKIDNTCYYNGLACLPVLGPDDQELGYSTWSQANPRNVGDPDGERCSCTWQAKDLEEGDLFFDLHDLKPGDWEEDTISFDVENPSWICVDFDLTSHIDNTCTEPEQEDEAGACSEPSGQGDLAQVLNFVFWIDDGDNVFEKSERLKTIANGNASQVFGGTKKTPIADSGTTDGPIGPETSYVGKFFCLGNLTRTPVDDGEGSPLERGTGFTCDGSVVDNKPQTDLLTVDMTFEAVQARHNEEFLCNPPVL